MKIGRPVSQHRPLPDVGGPEVAEHGEVLRAPGGTVVVTAMATGAAGGEDGAEGAEGVVLWKHTREVGWLVKSHEAKYCF